MARFTPRAETVEVDTTVLPFTFVLVLCTCLALGWAPALSGDRSDLASALRKGGSNTETGGRLRLRGALVAAQVAVSVVLLVAAGLLLRSFERLQSLDPGFDTERLVSARMSLNWSKYDDRGRVLALVLRQGMGMVLVGVLVGLLGALAFGHLLADLLFQTGVYDPLVLLSVPAVLLTAAFVACLGPALRAMALDPTRALRSE